MSMSTRVLAEREEREREESFSNRKRERERGNEDKSIYGSEKCDQESKLKEED